MTVATDQVTVRTRRERLRTVTTIASAKNVAAAWVECPDGNDDETGCCRRRSTGGRSRPITSFASTLRSDAPPTESARNNASHRRRATSNATTTTIARGMTTALLPSQVTTRIASVHAGV